MRVSRAIFALSGVLVFSSTGSWAVAQDSAKDPPPADPGKLTVQATLLRNPGSLCDVPRPSAAFRISFRAGVSTTTRGCMDMDTTRAVPVMLAIRNADTTQTVAYQLPQLADVTVKTAKGDRAAIAVYFRAGQNAGYMTEYTGFIDLHLRPKDTLWLLYLVPAPVAGSRLQVKGLVPSAVRID